MKENLKIQDRYCSLIDRRRFCSYEKEFIDAPTTYLIHQASRFLYFLDGEGIIIINNIEYSVKKDTMVVIMPWDITYVKSVNKPLEFIKIIYNLDYISSQMRSNYNPSNKMLSIVETVSKVPIIPFSGKYCEKIKTNLSDIKDVIGMENIDTVEIDDVDEIYIVNKLIEILILCFKQAMNQNIEINNNDMENITTILKYIYSHLQEKITLDKLAKIFYMSESAISKYIQDSIGITFSDLVNDMRLMKVMDLLMYSDFSLNDIADTVGFSDASHLLKIFTSSMGTTPNEYRKIYGTSHNALRKKEIDLTYDIINYIYNNYTEEITPAKLASKFNISIIELNHILMFEVEKNCSDYIDYLRINKACELLKTTNDAICDIAIACGYNTTKTFNRIFVNHKGMTPGVFRKNIELQSSDGTIIR